MSWRTVVISSRCKLDYRMGYLEIRGDDTKRIFLDEIAVLMIENPAVSFTGCLIEALVQEKIKVIFCDSKMSPLAELAPYYGSHDCSRKIKTQTLWPETLRGVIWNEIVTEKIKRQADLLFYVGKKEEGALLNNYVEQIEDFDATNREGHAAKVYFNALFGTGFTRSEDNVINAALNYGYSIILSAFNREIIANGYLTQVGLFHDNMFNFFNLSCDLMEPYRIIVDKKVKFMELEETFSMEQKRSLIDILNQSVIINQTKQTVLNAIKIYVKSVFDALNDADISLIKHYKGL